MVRRTIPRAARALTAVGLVAAAAALAVVLAGSRTRPVTTEPPAALAIHAELTPATTTFGDRVVAQIVIELNARKVRSQTLRYQDSLSPLTALGRARISRSADGSLDLITIVQPVACITSSCISRKGPASPTLPTLEATASRIDGGSVRVSARWPTLYVHGRAVGSDLSSNSPRFAVSTQPPQPRYPISPSALATLLECLGGIAALGVLILLSWQGHIYARGRERHPRDELERAIALTRAAEGMPIPQRRRAVGLLARVLRREDLAADASALAWSRHDPGPDELRAIATAAEQERS